MAMYYYACKISAMACGTRCRQNVLQKSRGQRDRDKYNHSQFIAMKEKNDRLHGAQEVSSPIKTKSSENSCKGTISDTKCRDKGGCSSRSGCCGGTNSCSSSGSFSTKGKGTTSIASSSSCKDFSMELCVLGTGGVMYINRSIVSGPLDSLVDLLMPKTVDEIDKEYVFSFLLSSRLFIRPHELLGKLISSVPETESLGRIVGLLNIWTRTFPYDFRDERIMSHVKHIVARCSKTGLEDIVSEMLSALLNRLTDLERHEENLRACQSNGSGKTDSSFDCPNPTHFAQLLSRAERRLGKHVGPEEFVQSSRNILQDKQMKKSPDQPSTSGGPPGIQASKKTCNLETYLEWSARLRLFVCNEILQCHGIRERSKIVEQWSGVARNCLSIGNYNSATAILESLESAPIARLKTTWSKVPSTCQQLDYLQRHAEEGYSDRWRKQTVTFNLSDMKDSKPLGNSRPKSSEWVVIPVFADIVKLAIVTREECLDKLPNGHINVTAFDRLAAIVGAFTKHMAEVKSPSTDAKEFETFYRYMQSSSILNESELMLASFDCEEPNVAEKALYNLT